MGRGYIMATTDFPLGAIVDATVDARSDKPETIRGIVRYFGTTEFAPGQWVGMELSEPRGKNDGSVKGVRYFSCKMSYGVFVRSRNVAIVQLPVRCTTILHPLRPNLL